MPPPSAQSAPAAADATCDGDGRRPLRLVLRADRWIRAVFFTCLTAEILFFVLDYHVNYGRASDIGAIRRLFNTAREDGLASWFGTAQTSLIALTLWGTWLVTRARPGSLRASRGWLVLAAFFTYLTVDDGAQLHERMGTAFEHLRVGAWERILGLFPSYTWQLVFLPLFAAVGVFLVVFVWRQCPDSTTRGLLVAGLGCLAFAVVLDFFEGLDEDHPWNVYTRLGEARPGLAELMIERFRRKPFDAFRHFSKSLEETLEMFAYTLIWVAFLRHLARTAPAVDLRVRTAPEKPQGP